jgi:ATP-dependent DNA helicase RecQ
MCSGAVVVDAGMYKTLQLGEPARALLRDQAQVWQRVASTSASKGAASRTTNKTDDTDLDVHAQPVFTALKAWRAEVARSHDLPAYVIFNNNTLKALAQLRPSDADELVGVPGIGSKKLEAYGDQVLRVIAMS